MDTETEKMEIEMDKNQNESAGDYKFPIWMPFRRKFTPDGPFFAPGNAERELLAKQYECLVEGCGMKFNTDRARHRHLVDKHKFPMSFEFHKRRHPSKRQRQRQRLRARHSSNTGETPLDKENMEVEKNIDALASAVSNLTTEDNTPAVVTFGRRHNRAFGFVPHSLHRKTS